MLLFLLILCSHISISEMQAESSCPQECFVEYFARDYLRRNKRALSRSKSKRHDVVSVHITSSKDQTQVKFLAMNPDDAFVVTPTDTIGSSRISISFIEVDTVLFFWDDENTCLSEDVIKILGKYDFVRFSENEWEYIFHGVNDDGLYIPTYTFSKGNIRHYHRTISKRMHKKCGKRKYP